MHLSDFHAEGRFIFSKKVLNTLYNAGWSSTRSENISSFIQALNADGHEVFPVVKDFLSRFGGLEIIYTSRAGYKDSLHFDAKAATEAIFPEQVREYEEVLGTSLCIIGEFATKHSTLMMSPQGQVYGGYDEGIVFCGQNGEQAIENIVIGQNLKQLTK